MKIIVITSSPRGAASQTQRLVAALAEGAQAEGARVETIDLCKLKVEFCKACEVCHRTGNCVYTDDVPGLRKNLLAADGIVLASPNYFRMVTAPMKALIDRLSGAIHCQSLEGKYAASLSTAGGPDCEEVIRYLDDFVVSLGAWSVGGVSASMSQGPEAMARAEEKALLLGRDLVAAIKEKRVYPDQQERHERTAAYFRRLVELNKERWPYEYQRWFKSSES